MALRFRRVTIVALLLVLVALPAWAGEKVSLTILHTNDLHGMMLPFDYTDESGYFKSDQRGMGGMARRATLIESIRAATPNVALVDAGDVFTRGPWHETWYGMPEVEAMNVMGYDALCVGNNEVKAIWDSPRSKGLMLALMRRSRFAWLAANLTLGDGPPPGCDAPAFVEGIHPFIVRTFGDLRVGFLGLTNSGASEFTFLKGWTFTDPVEVAKRWVPIARKECDVLIAVTHLGEEWDRILAAQAPGIDAIIGGHSHTFLPEPVRIAGPDGTIVPIVQAGELGVILGRFDLTFERADPPSTPAWKLTEAKETLLPITSALPEDAAMKALLDRYLKPEAAATLAR
jgi:2',3'-cyclic-nucleotide 2'-phosphodiesterase (5'-nucleotidase family)